MSFVPQALNIACFLLAAASLAIFISNTQLENEIFRLTSDAESLKTTLEDIHKTCPDKVVSAFPRIPATHVISHNKNELQGLDVQRNVTFILLYNSAEKDAWDCLTRQIDHITKSFPKVKIVCSVMGGKRKEVEHYFAVQVLGIFKTEAEAINSAVQRVKTTYFLLLRPDVVIDPKGSDNSIEWLHHALVVTPGVDIIGGSMLLGNKELVIPCYSINFCNWTLTQNYEYRRSFGEVMICDEVSHSFMARTEIRSKFGNNLFDKNLELYLYTDFFLKAKTLGLTTANRPEVMFFQTLPCSSQELPPSKLMDAAIPFSKKHNILQFKDPEKRTSSICDGSDKHICTVQNMVENWKFPKWHESGMFAYPFVINQTTNTLEVVSSQLKTAGLKFALRGETLFGAIMTRSVLPWGELKAVQFWAFATKTEVSSFANSNHYKYEIKENIVTLLVKVPHFPRAMQVKMVLKSLKDEQKFANIRVNGKLYPILQDPISELKSLYGDRYLAGVDSKTQTFSCKIGKHHACLPDATSRGASTYREKYCEI